MPESVDFLVIGGGVGGYATALAAAHLGREVLLVDVDGTAGLGGTCLRVGCIPSKAFIELADQRRRDLAWQTRKVLVGDSEVAMDAFQEWKLGVVSDLNAGVASLLAAAGVEIRQGHFRFTRPNQGVLSTGDDRPPVHLQFRSCVIATGSRPAELPVLPFNGRRILSSTDLLVLQHLPSSLTVVGGGYIGVELGAACAKLGVEVTMIEAQSQLLPGMSSEAARAVALNMKKFGATVHLSSSVVADENGLLTIESDAGRTELPAERILVAVGRIPNTDDLGLDALGMGCPSSGILPVGPDLLLTERIAAVGDVTPGSALAHKASAQALVAARNLSGQRDTFEPRAIPEVVFADPEIAQAGLTTDAARTLDIEIDRANFPIAASGKARILGERLGHAEWIVARASRQVLGVTIIGPRASEIVAEAVLAIEMGATLDDLALTIHPHPTMSEVLAESAMAGLGRPVHVLHESSASTLKGRAP